MLRDWVKKYAKLLLTYYLSACFSNVGLSETFAMKSVTAHYDLTSSEAARTRTMGAVSRNDEEGFVWIIPWYSDYHW